MSASFGKRPKGQRTDSKIGLVGLGRPCILVRVVVSALVVGYILRADALVPKFPQGAPIRDEAFPRHGEDAFVRDREFELQSVALVVGIDVVGRYVSPFFEAARQCLNSSLVTN